MNPPALMLEAVGPSSTVQDLGRYGHIDQGVAPSGAFDTRLLAVANRLVGNPADAAAVEMTLRGDIYRVMADSCRCSIAGDFNVQVDGQAMPPWRTYTLQRGQVLAVGVATSGVRGYLAVEGGFNVPRVLGSHSVHVRTGIGPTGGAALRSGLLLPLHRSRASDRIDLRFDTEHLPRLASRLRVVLGPQDGHFTGSAVEEFLGGSFELTPACDRMGMHLIGPALQARAHLPLISEGVSLGSVQVLPGGRFILNMPDRQTVGGYPKIATIISADIRHLAQMRPGARLEFECVSLSRAHQLLSEERAWLAQLNRLMVPADIEQLPSEFLLSRNLISGAHRD